MSDDKDTWTKLVKAFRSGRVALAHSAEVSPLEQRLAKLEARMDALLDKQGSWERRAVVRGAGLDAQADKIARLKARVAELAHHEQDALEAEERVAELEAELALAQSRATVCDADLSAMEEEANEALERTGELEAELAHMKALWGARGIDHMTRQGYESRIGKVPVWLPYDEIVRPIAEHGLTHALGVRPPHNTRLRTIGEACREAAISDVHVEALARFDEEGEYDGFDDVLGDLAVLGLVTRHYHDVVGDFSWVVGRYGKLILSMRGVQ